MLYESLQQNYVSLLDLLYISTEKNARVRRSVGIGIGRGVGTGVGSYVGGFVESGNGG